MNENLLKTQIADKYRDCISYADAGQIITEGIRMAFRTYFRRPTHYQFQWKNISEETDWEFVRLPISTASSPTLLYTTTVSRGATPLIAKLLMPNIGTVGHDFVSLEPFQWEGDELVGEVLLGRIKTTKNEERQTILWIDQRDLSIRRIKHLYRTVLPAPELMEKIEQLDPLAASSIKEQTKYTDVLDEIIFDNVEFNCLIPDDVFI